MNNSEQKRALLAVVLSGVVLFAWQYFFAPQTPVNTQGQQTNSVAVSKTKNGTTKNTNVTQGSATTVAAKNPTTDIPLKEYVQSNENFQFRFDNQLGLKEIKSSEAVFDFNATVDSENPFQISLVTATGYEPISFEIEKISETKFRGLNSLYGIQLSGELTNEGLLNFSLASKNTYRYQIKFNSTEKALDNRQIRKFLVYAKDLDSTDVGSENDGEGSVNWMAIDFNYHLFSLVLDRKYVGRWKTTEPGTLTFEISDPTTTIGGSFLYAKKNYDKLAAVGNNLHLAVDFGIFGLLAVPILRGLQFFYKYIPNYGIAIILLTMIVRLITFPLQYKSFKSMKKMQQVQPELAKIKEKFKEDPQRMQKETMELFKRAGANPLGGCLPLLLQTPVFIAFYNVLYAAVELVEAPFALWITDLSIKDPFYIFPILWVLSMVVQQKVTPSTAADPTQKKVMMFMPILFGFFLKDMPSGLVLYIFVSTVLGLLQQMLVYRTVD